MGGTERLDLEEARPVGQGRDEVDVAVTLDPLAEGDAASQVEAADQAVGNGGQERRTHVGHRAGQVHGGQADSDIGP